MKRRLNIGCSLVHEPKILILDEPTVGLDPDSRMSLWNVIRMIHREGVTVILTTHYMDEADILCDRLAIMDQGKIIAIGEPEKLKDVIKEDVIVIESKPGDFDEIVKKIIPLQGVTEVKMLVHALEVRAKDSEKLLPRIVRMFGEAHEEIVNVNVRKPTLEDVYLFLTSRKRAVQGKPAPSKPSGLKKSTEETPIEEPKVEEW